MVAMASIIVSKIKPTDFGELASVYSSALESLPTFFRPAEDERNQYLQTLQEDVIGYAAKRKRAIEGFATVSRDLRDAFFPDSHSFRKEQDLLDRIAYNGEPTVVLTGIYVDVAVQRSGIGKELFRSLMSYYPKSTWLLLCPADNQKACSFFLHLGFEDLGVDSSIEGTGKGKHLFVKKYRPKGLCREAYW